MESLKDAGRYSRQVLFSQVGIKGQHKLSKSRVLIVGCGGLGSNIANNLTRAGVGFIRLIDKDKIELSDFNSLIRGLIVVDIWDLSIDIIEVNKSYK